jgi:hypothetical protein
VHPRSWCGRHRCRPRRRPPGASAQRSSSCERWCAFPVGRWRRSRRTRDSLRAARSGPAARPSRSRRQRADLASGPSLLTPKVPSS